MVVSRAKNQGLSLNPGFDFVHNLLHMTGDKVLQPFHDPSAMVVALFNGVSAHGVGGRGGPLRETWH